MFKLQRLTALALAAALLAPGLALAQRQRPQRSAKRAPAADAAARNTDAGGAMPQIQFTEFRLANGLRVLLHEDHSTPIVGVNLWYHVGSKNEVPGKTGFAHLFEHMMFQGSKNYDDDYFKPIQEAGGTLNGSTNPDRTNYWEIVPSNFLELALFMEADRMGGLLDVLDEKKFRNQQDVVKNEKRQNYDNRPYGLVGAKINSTLYPKNHPYHWLTIGSLEDLTAASLDDVKDFFRRFYTPNNASLCIAGDFDPTEARRLVEKYFGPIPRGPEVRRVGEQRAALAETKRIGMEDRVALARLYLVWPVPPQFTADEAPLDALASLLAGGKSSRLYRSLVYERQIAQDVSAFNNAQEIAGQFQIVATAKPGKTLAELEGAINEELERIKEAPPTADELERVYNAREASFIYNLQTVGGFGGKNDQLNQYATFLGRPDYFRQDLARYRAVTADDVRRVARTYLTDRRLVIEVKPRGRGQTSAAGPVPEGPQQAAQQTAQQTAGAQPGAGAQGAGAADKPAGAQPQNKPAAAATQPAGAAPPTSSAPVKAEEKAAKRAPQRDLSANLPKPKSDPRFQLPRVQRRKLSNGLNVLVVEHKELPVVTLNLVVKSGAAADPRERPGVASLTADLLDEGTKTLSALELSNALASIGARLSAGADFDSTGVSLLTLKRHLDRALDLYADVVLNPAFPENDLKRLRSSRLTALQQRRDDANAIAGLVYSSLLYGREHPYGHPAVGDEQSLPLISEQDVRRFYETYYRPNNSALIVVGDVTPAQLMPKLEKAFGAWRRGDVPAVDVAPPAAGPRGGIYLVDRPGAAQSVIQIGQIGVARSTPDYFPLLVMNTILGGGFVSRINLNLREEKGYTYGARSGFDYRRGPGPFTASAGVETRVTKESVTEFLKELRGIRGAVPVTERELEYAKQGLIRGFPRTFETPDQIAGRLASVVLYDLPDDYFNSYLARVRAVTLKDVERVANRYLDPDRMAILVVGDRKVIEPGLRSLEGVGETITLLDAEGRTSGTGGGTGSGSNRQ